MLAAVHRMCWARHHGGLGLSLNAPAYGLCRRVLGQLNNKRVLLLLFERRVVHSRMDIGSKDCYMAVIGRTLWVEALKLSAIELGPVAGSEWEKKQMLGTF